MCCSLFSAASYAVDDNDVDLVKLGLVYDAVLVLI